MKSIAVHCIIFSPHRAVRLWYNIPHMAKRIDHAARRQFIVERSMGLFARLGYAKVSFLTISEATGVARTALYRAGVTDMADAVIEVSPEVAALILKAKIALSTDNGETLETGCLGSIGGCKVYVSANIAKESVDGKMQHKCLVRTKRAIAFAEQLSEIDAYRPEKRFADAVKGLHLYGAKVVHPAEMVLLNLSVAV